MKLILCSIVEVFDYVRSSSITFEVFDYRTFHCVRLVNFLGEFDLGRLPNAIEVNRAIEFD